MKKLRLLPLLCALLLLAFAPPAATAQEKVTLGAPVQTDAGATEFRLNQLYVNRMDRTVQFEIREVDGSINPKPTGKFFTFVYSGSQATTLMTTINTSNFTTISLEKRAIQYAQNNDDSRGNRLPAGTISGTPQ